MLFPFDGKRGVVWAGDAGWETPYEVEDGTLLQNLCAPGGHGWRCSLALSLSSRRTSCPRRPRATPHPRRQPRSGRRTTPLLIKERGNLTVWFSDDVVDGWLAPREARPGRPAVYSDLATEVALTVRAVYRLPLRQAEGFLKSIAKRLGLPIAVPDYTTLSRRSKDVCVFPIPPRGDGPIEIAADSSGLKIYVGRQRRRFLKGAAKRRPWRKLHVADRLILLGQGADQVPGQEGGERHGWLRLWAGSLVLGAELMAHDLKDRPRTDPITFRPHDDRVRSAADGFGKATVGHRERCPWCCHHGAARRLRPEAHGTPVAHLRRLRRGRTGSLAGRPHLCS